MTSLDELKGKEFGFSDSKVKPLIARATTELMSKYSFITLEETDEILYYKDGVDVHGADKLIATETEKMFHFDLQNKHLTEIRGHIMRRTYHKKEELDSDINTINLKNGLYDIDNDRLLKHTPAYLSINQKNIVYDKDARPKRFIKFLQEVLYPRDILTAIDAIAYTFHRDYTIETIFILLGFGGNGKSVYTSLITSMHGVGNVSNVPLSEMLGGDKFALSDLENKDVNIDNELAGQTIKETSVIKKLTGGSRQPVRIQRKNQRAYDTILYTKLFFNANRMPTSPDMTDAYHRRITAIPFPNRFEGNTEDKQLKSKLTNESEISGIFNILMRALRRIKRDGEIYVNEKTTEEKKTKYEIATDPIRSFIEATIIWDESAIQVEKELVYEVYKKYCQIHSIPTEKYIPFCRQLKNKFGLEDERITEQDKKTKVAYWKAIIVASDYAPVTEPKEE